MVDSFAVSDTSSALACPPINLIYSHYHNAIRSELDRLSKTVNKLEKSSVAKLADRLLALKTQYRFLAKVYKYHSSVEDEVVYPALSAKVKNVTLAYSVEHEAEERLFEQLTPLLNQALLQTGKQQAAILRRLVCKVEEIHMTLRKHLAKEEDQLFPLLLKHFTFAEQAELVAQFLCCIPLAGIDAVLSWLKPAVPQEEQDQLVAQVRSVVPDQLLLQMLVTWLGPVAQPAAPARAEEKLVAKAEAGETAGKERLVQQPNRPPLKEISYLHTAIRSAMESFASEAKVLERQGDFDSTQLSALVDRHRFLRSVCSYHQASEDEVLFPAVRDLSLRAEALASCKECEVEHSAEVGTWENLGRLLNDVRACVRRGAKEVAVLMRELCDAAESACQDLTSHMEREELQVLPVLEEKLGHAEQRSMVWHTLRAMPLRLLERVMPWLAGKLSEEEASEMLANMKLAAPEDAALVQLLSRWAQRGRRSSPEPQDHDDPNSYANHTCGVKGCHHKRGSSDADAEIGQPAAKRPKPTPEVKKSAADEPADEERRRSSHAASVSGAPADGSRYNPIDHIFQFHKALKRELSVMEAEALRFAAVLESATELNSDPAKLTQQLEGRFRFLWGIYRAHSEAEDEVVFPALEAKEALHNVSHAYTLDHQHENELFSEVEQVFGSIRGITDLEQLRASAAQLQRMCAAMRATLHEHVKAEEQELWPLFAENFSVAEQEDIVGMIIGRTGAEVLQAMLPWVTVSFTEGEQRAMMDSFRNASKNTMFEQWLDATMQPPASAGAPPLSAEATPPSAGAPTPQQPGAAELREAGQQLPLKDLVQYLTDDEADTDKPAEAKNDAGPRESLEASVDPSSGGASLPSQQGAAPAASHVATDAAVAVVPVESVPSPVSATFKPGWQDIFRMNQKQLEGAVRRMQKDAALDAERKAYLMQNIMASRYIVAQQQRVNQVAPGPSPGGPPSKTFHDAAAQTLGCPHYMRKCQVIANCCGRVYGCRHCHDDAEDHRLEPRNITRVVCMACATEQPAAAECSACGIRLGRYYCSICRLWDDQPGRPIYHCPFCNLCRRGRGLGIDACHCMHCNTCMHLSEFKAHTCRDLSTCPICTEYLFDSNQPYRELVCGHFMHSHCFGQYTRYHYTCPICAKSLGDMSVYFRMIDSMVAHDRTSLPPTVRDRIQEVLCNDCGETGRAEFHFVYHKCPHCASYNTRLA